MSWPALYLFQLCGIWNKLNNTNVPNVPKSVAFEELLPFIVMAANMMPTLRHALARWSISKNNINREI